MIAAKPVAKPEAKPWTAPASRLPGEDDLAVVRALVESFSVKVPFRLAGWKSKLESLHRAGQRIVLGGGGSKAVAFLTTLKITEEVEAAVDINPNKHGTFLAGSGHAIAGPEYLLQYPPDLVIVMNPVYKDEIASQLAGLGLSTRLTTIEEGVEAT
jgi:hypothetical protein